MTFIKSKVLNLNLKSEVKNKQLNARHGELKNPSL